MNNKQKVEPGWNDPPMLNYSASNPPPKSRITNKRIAFPLNNTSDIPSSTAHTLPKSIPIPPMIPPAVKPFPSTENALETLSKLLNSEEARQNFKKMMNNQLPENFQRSISLMTCCLSANDNHGAELHKQRVLSEYKEFCDGWLDDIKFEC